MKVLLRVLMAAMVVALAFTSVSAKEKKKVIVIKTEKGNIEIELNHKDAPKHAENFEKLTKDGFYNGLTFHRVEPNFVVQGGDPSGNGTGGPGYTIPAEIKAKHVDGAVAAARLGDAANPKKASSGSQFYICLGPQSFLDGNYTVFGQVVKGMDVARKIQRGDKMISVTIEEK
ncbi:MAG: peptidylprolyl isomerase [Nitrospirae bacterium]|nr:peptidylprolyl isomerase [Nitrospirota bacterium]MBI5695097.1 peptidylprolyl isomerase [Nitrospirota bacterium]